MDFSIAQVFDAVAARYPDSVAIAGPDGRLTYRTLAARTDAIAAHLAAQGLAFAGPVETGSSTELRQPRVGLLAHNTQQHLEAMLACYKARAIPFNINYRYTAEEVGYLVRDAGADALFVESGLEHLVPKDLWPSASAPSKPLVAPLPAQASGPGDPAWDLFEALATAAPSERLSSTGEDRYLLYTGGTTGYPKGVIWRQADVLVRAMGCRNAATGAEYDSIEDLLRDLEENRAGVQMTGAPLMHGGGQWFSLRCLCRGGTLVLPGNSRSFEPGDVMARCFAEGVDLLMIVGDAFGVPLIEELERRGPGATPLKALLTGGVRMSDGVRRRLLELVPGLRIANAAGSSEAGTLISQISTRGAEPPEGLFAPGDGACIVSADRSRFLRPGDTQVGWLATTGRMPLGYLNDPAKTAEVIVQVEGRACLIVGDRAQWVDDQVRLLGRDSLTINTGGEKVFAEEVESALLSDSRVRDAIVLGTPHPRWGEQVTALVEAAKDQTLDPAEVPLIVRARLAPYKAPRRVLIVPAVQRLANGKADYAWAKSAAEE